MSGNKRNITGLKPLPITEPKTLSSVIKRTEKKHAVLTAAIEDILSLMQVNIDLEQDERNVKMTDCIIKRHEGLLKEVLNDDLYVNVIISALDTSFKSKMSALLSTDSKSDSSDKNAASKTIKSIKEQVVKHILEALSDYKLIKKTKESKSETTEKETKDKKNTEPTEHLIDLNLLNVYFNNATKYMLRLYKSKLKSNQLQNAKLGKVIASKKVKSGNLLKSISGTLPTDTVAKKPLIKTANISLISHFKKPIDKPKSEKAFTLRKFGVKILRLNKPLKQSRKQMIDYAQTYAITAVVKPIADKIKKTLAPIVKKVKKFINKIVKTVVNFVLGMIPFAGPIIKVLLFAIKPILFVLKVVFKTLTFAVKFIGKSLKLLFTGAFKIMKGLVKGIFKSVKLLTGGIFKLLNKRTIAKVLAFIMTPAGALITGYIVGLVYHKIYKPIKMKVDELGGFIEVIKSLYHTVVDNVTRWKNAIVEKFEDLKKKFDKPTGKFGEIMKCILTLDVNKLKVYWKKAQIRIKLKIILPVKNFIKGVKDFFVETVIRCASGGVVALIAKALSAFPPYGTIIGGVIGVAASVWEMLYEDNDDARDKKNLVNEEKLDLLRLYGGSRGLDRQGEHNDLIDLATKAGADKDNTEYSTAVKKTIQKKLQAQKEAGVITLELQDRIDTITLQINDERDECAKLRKNPNNLNKHKIMKMDNSDRDALFTTKIPVPMSPDKDGKVEFTDKLILPLDVNPVTFRMARAETLYRMLQKYTNGLMYFDDFMDFYMGLIHVDEKSKGYVFDDKLLDSNEDATVVKMIKSTLNYNEHGNIDRFTLKGYSDFVVSDLSLNLYERSANMKRRAIQNMIASLTNVNGINLLETIPKDKYPQFLSDLTNMLMHMNLKEFSKKSKEEKAQFLLEKFDDLNADIEKQIQDEEEEKLKKEEAETEASLKTTELNIAEAETEADENSSSGHKEGANEQTTESIAEQDTPAGEISKSDAMQNEQTQRELDTATEEAKLNKTAEVTKTEVEIDETKDSLQMKIAKLRRQLKKLMTPDKKVIATGSQNNDNAALLEALRECTNA